MPWLPSAGAISYLLYLPGRWFASWPLFTQGRERQKKEGAAPDRSVAGWISKGTSVQGLSWVSTGWVVLGNQPPCLKSLYRGFIWVQLRTQPRWSQHHHSFLRLCPWGSFWELESSRLHTARTGKEPPAALGPAQGPTGSHLLFTTYPDTHRDDHVSMDITCLLHAK